MLNHELNGDWDRTQGKRVPAQRRARTGLSTSSCNHATSTKQISYRDKAFWMQQTLIGQTVQ